MFNKLTQQVRQPAGSPVLHASEVEFGAWRNRQLAAPQPRICFLFFVSFFVVVVYFFNSQFAVPSGLFYSSLLSQHLKLPRCLVFVIQTVGVEIELPR